MNSYGLGDLAQTFLLQRRGADIKTDVARLTEELASGQVSDTKSILSGNVAYLTDIESDLRSLSAYQGCRNGGCAVRYLCTKRSWPYRCGSRTA